MFLTILSYFLLFSEPDPCISLLTQNRVAVLSTVLPHNSTKMTKGPFGSLVPYMLDEDGNPILFLSNLAVHTKNIKKEPKGSITVIQEDKTDAFNSARVTIIGTFKKVQFDKKTFLKQFPEANPFIDFEDFNFYQLEVKWVFYVGGFGDISWISLKEYRRLFKQ